MTPVVAILTTIPFLWTNLFNGWKRLAIEAEAISIFFSLHCSFPRFLGNCSTFQSITRSFSINVGLIRSFLCVFYVYGHQGWKWNVCSIVELWWFDLVSLKLLYYVSYYASMQDELLLFIPCTHLLFRVRRMWPTVVFFLFHSRSCDDSFWRRLERVGFFIDACSLVDRSAGSVRRRPRQRLARHWDQRHPSLSGTRRNRKPSFCSLLKVCLFRSLQTAYVK